MRRKLWLEMLIDHVAEQDDTILHLEPKLQVRRAMVAVGKIFPAAKDRLSRSDRLGFMGFADRFSYNAAKIYKIGERFGSHLARANLLNVPPSMLRLRAGDSFCIEFPDDLMFEGPHGEFWRTCLVNVGGYVPAQETSLGSPTDPRFQSFENLSLSLSFPDYDCNGITKFVNTYMHFRLHKPTIEECLLEIEGKHGLTITPEAFNYVVKCLLYIKSGEPDLKQESGYYTPTKKPKKIRRQNENFCRFDVTNVGYGFHGRVWHVDSTQVTGHFRWQPYGPGRQQIKLKWIEEHVRNFKEPEACQ